MRVTGAPAPTIELDIDALGDGGDGVASIGGRRIHVPWTLPGDRVAATPLGAARALPTSWIRRSPAHAAPPCAHFGSCGGCALQHLAAEAYRAWKQGIATRTAQRAGFPDAEIATLAMSPPASRRRATLAAVRSAAGMALGFHAPSRRDIVDLAACPVMSPALATLLGPLRAALADVLAPAQRCDIALTATAEGADMLVLGDLRHDALRPLAVLPGLARLARAQAPDRDPEIVAQHRPPRIDFDGIAVEPPPGVFLQATREGEAAIRDAVATGLGAARRVADLFAGAGTLSLPLARDRQILAVDSHRPALSALDRAARAAGLGARMTVIPRDLARRPLTGDELAGFEAAIFDPPREGALPQAEALARGGPDRVIAVSCNPVSFARDAVALAAGGYRLERLTPIDQFLWSPHLELVGVFARPRRSHRRPR